MSDSTEQAVVVYSKAQCPYCDYAKNLLGELKIPYEEVRVDLNPDRLDEMLDVSGGKKTFPQIVVNGIAVGGYTDLLQYHQSGKLNDLLGLDG
jgi:glutaredoxin 3